MELRRLRYFVAVAEELHFRRAAVRLHVAQPAVSEQIRKLEQELGVPLLDRDQRHVELTEAGTALLGEARLLLHQADVATQVTRSAQTAAVRRLRLGYTPAALPTAVSLALRTVASGRPGIATTLQDAAADALLDGVRDDRLDAAIVCLPAPLRGLRATPLGALTPVAALPASDPRAQQPVLDLARLAPERLLVLPRATCPPLHDAIVSACRRAGCSPALVEVGGAHVESALLAVASGAGIALLPDVAAERWCGPGIRLRPLADETLACPLAVVTRRDPSEGTVAFLHAVSRVARLRAAPARDEVPVAA